MNDCLDSLYKYFHIQLLSLIFMVKPLLQVVYMHTLKINLIMKLQVSPFKNTGWQLSALEGGVLLKRYLLSKSFWYNQRLTLMVTLLLRVVVSITGLKSCLQRGSCSYPYFMNKEEDIRGDAMYWVIQWNHSQTNPKVQVSHPHFILDTIRRQICCKTQI